MGRPTKEQQAAKRQAAQAHKTAADFEAIDALKIQARDFITIEEAAFLYNLDIEVVRNMVRRYDVIPYRGKDNRIYIRKTDFRYSMTGEALACDEAARLTFDE